MARRQERINWRRSNNALLENVHYFDVKEIEKMFLRGEIKQRDLLNYFEEVDLSDTGSRFPCIICQHCPLEPNNVFVEKKEDYIPVTYKDLPDEYYEKGCICGRHLIKCDPGNIECLGTIDQPCIGCKKTVQCSKIHGSFIALLEVAKNFRGYNNYLMALIKYYENIYGKDFPVNYERIVFDPKGQKGKITLLHYTTGEITKYLLDNGANPNHIGMHLKKKDFNSNERVAHFQTPIFLAGNLMTNPLTNEIYGDRTTVDYLIAAGADVNFRNNFGRTPLFYANEKMVLQLIKGGVNLFIKDYDGKTAYDLAIRGKKRLLGELMAQASGVSAEQVRAPAEQARRSSGRGRGRGRGRYQSPRGRFQRRR